MSSDGSDVPDPISFPPAVQVPVSSLLSLTNINYYYFCSFWNFLQSDMHHACLSLCPQTLTLTSLFLCPNGDTLCMQMVFVDPYCPPLFLTIKFCIQIDFFISNPLPPHTSIMWSGSIGKSVGKSVSSIHKSSHLIHPPSIQESGIPHFSPPSLCTATMATPSPATLPAFFTLFFFFLLFPTHTGCSWILMIFWGFPCPAPSSTSLPQPHQPHHLAHT